MTHIPALSKRIPITSLILLIVVSMISTGESGNGYKYKFQNPELPVSVRVNDLISHLTLEEKVGQMMNAAPAIERLGIPEYNWWNECLHGVARAGLATVFPQAIGLGATWDDSLMYQISTAISDEARAKYNEFTKQNKRLIYQGLTFWSPNINIFRDPRWGRGQETYGEDPFLTGKLGVQFIKGLQGNDPKYLKTVATPKHFAVHSGPEPLRHHFNAQTDARILREFYLPQFKMAIEDAHAQSVMCAYNRYNGEACCGNDSLLNGILRKEWGFNGYIVSDCGAIGDIYKNHKLVATAGEASALGVSSGCDLNCGTVYSSLIKDVKDGLISEAKIDTSVKRLFTARFKLGMFDPPSMVKYDQIPYSVVDSKEHKQLALKAAHESMVLLKNENHFLPLDKNVGTVAVIGPNADDANVLLGNYNGIPSDPITPLRGIREKLAGKSKVLYARGCELVAGLPIFESIPAAVLTHDSLPGLKADFYNSHDHTGPILYSEIDDSLNVNWHEGAPRKDMDGDNFGVIWTGEITPQKTGTYLLGFVTTCKVELYLNDSMIANTHYHFRDEYGDPRLRKSAPIRLEAGKHYKFRLVAGETYGVASVKLVWSIPRANPAKELMEQAIQVAKKADLVVLCMGLSSRVEGEEMDIELDGFDHGDRTKLTLPDVQENLIKAIYNLGKPTVLVLLNGGALAINWENAHIPAILEAWYPGQAGGQAIADVLFGDYNPGGRLPVTFYRSVNDLPPFDQYQISTQTYRYFKGEPLYPFGYGLSYTSFSYGALTVKNVYKVGDNVPVSVSVTNRGEMAGDEVVQVYISDLNAPVPVPIRKLCAFKRISLKAGETRNISFVLPADAFAVYTDQGKQEILPGKYSISVGGGQPGTIARTLQKEVSLE